MKNKFLSFILLTSLLTLTGCPIELDYSLGNSGTEKNEPKLFGKWRIDDLEETIISFSISKLTESTMRVELIEKNEFFTPNTNIFTGWVVSLGGKRFLCFEENANPGKFYHYILIDVNESQLKVCPLDLYEGGIAIKSQENLRQEVLTSINKPNFITTPIVYTKVK
jgi:hypothetical protein